MGGDVAVVLARAGCQTTVVDLQAAINLNNIFDKSYYRTIGTGTGTGTSTGNWYGDPRNVMGSLHAAF